MDVSKQAQQTGVNIFIAGRLADTEAEKALRRAANFDTQSLWADYMDGSAMIPEWARPYLTDEFLASGDPNIYNRANVLDFVAKYETTNYYQQVRGFNIEWYQAKISSEKSEVDVFLEGATPSQFAEFETFLINTFGVDEADIYNKLGIYPWMENRAPIPSQNIPSGSIGFGQDGSILHELIQ